MQHSLPPNCEPSPTREITPAKKRKIEAYQCSQQKSSRARPTPPRNDIMEMPDHSFVELAEERSNSSDRFLNIPSAVSVAPSKSSTQQQPSKRSQKIQRGKEDFMAKKRKINFLFNSTISIYNFKSISERI